MSKATLTDDIRSRVHKRIDELEPLVREYEELRRIMAAIETPYQPAAGRARARSRRASPTRPGRQRHGARAEQAQQLIAAQPGISVAELANKMGIGTTYLYRVRATNQLASAWSNEVTVTTLPR